MLRSPPKDNKDATPVRVAANKDGNVTIRSNKRQASSSPMQDVSLPSCDNIREIVKEVLKVELSGLVTQITQNISSEIRVIKDEIKDFKESLNFIHLQYEDLLREQKASVEAIKSLQSQNALMDSSIKDLNSRINIMEQRARASNLEVQCVPEVRNENLLTVIKQVSSLVGCTLAENEVINCSRVAKQNHASKRPRAIIVQFASPSVRDKVLAATIKFNKSHSNDKLNTSHIGIAGDKMPIYIAEHLSVANKALHAAARQTAKEKNFKFVWVRNGKIFMRKTEDSDYKFIRDINCLKNITD